MKKITQITQIFMLILISQNSFASVQLVSSVKSVIQTKCPYQAGNAVYKARTLYAVFNPMAQYNDRLNCLAITANKGGSSNAITNIDSLEENQTNAQAQQLADYIHYTKAKDSVVKNHLMNESLIQIYPNPATDYIEVNTQLNIGGEFLLFDLVGKVVVKETLKNQTTTIKLPMLANGTYTYKIKTQNEIYNGKLTIKE